MIDRSTTSSWGPPNRLVTRRQLLIASCLAGACMTGCTPRQMTSAPSGTVPLPIPKLAPSQLVAGTRSFKITAATGQTQLITGHPEILTPTMGYNGAFLGPTFRARRGEHIKVDIRNELGEMTTLHWHGMHLPAVMDGGPHSPIAAGERLTADWELNQPAATLWYHPHPHGQTQAQVLSGLAGMFIIDDDASLASGLPNDYGVDDVPLILQDRFLDADGRMIRGDDDEPLGVIGHTLLANGVSGTHFIVTTALIRLRLLNGSSARFLELRFDDDRTFTLVGTDGGLLSEAAELKALMLSPAERAEILVEFRPDERVTLRTERPVLAGVPEGIADMPGGDFVDFRSASRLQPAPTWHLPGEQRAALEEDNAARTRTFELRMPFLNGKLMDMERIDAIVRVGDIEIWEVTTPDLMPHNFHIHDAQFRVLDIDGGPPPPQLNGWKDTVPVLPGQTTRLIMRFEDYSDDKIPYMMHCHLLQHEDKGMMGQFLVTVDGTGPDRISMDGSHQMHS